MKKNNINELPMALLYAGLTMQVIFFVCSFILAVAPGIVLRLTVSDYTGGYSMPFDYVHFFSALITTVLVGIMFTLLMRNIKKGKTLGLGFGLLMGIMAYLTYFLATSVTTEFVISWLNALTANEELVATWSLGLEKNVTCYTQIVKYQLLIKYALKTAIVMILLSYGIYALCNKPQNTPKKL